MGRSANLMKAWWDNHDRAALDKLLASGACYSDTRDLGNAVASFGEHLVSRALGGVRLAQASPEGDCRLSNGRVIEVKTTSHPRRGWNLGYDPRLYPKLDYALVRLERTGWRVTEAWLVDAGLAAEHATGTRFRMPANGAWRDDASRLSLNRF